MMLEREFLLELASAGQKLDKRIGDYSIYGAPANRRLKQLSAWPRHAAFSFQPVKGPSKTVSCRGAVGGELQRG